MVFDHLFSEPVYMWTQIIFRTYQRQIPPASPLESFYPSFLTLKHSTSVQMTNRINNNGGEDNTTSNMDNGLDTLCRPIFSAAWMSRTCWAVLAVLTKTWESRASEKETCITQVQILLSQSDNSTIFSRNSAATFFNMGWVSMMLALFHSSNSTVSLLRLSWVIFN